MKDYAVLQNIAWEKAQEHVRDAANALDELPQWDVSVSEGVATMARYAGVSMALVVCLIGGATEDGDDFDVPDDTVDVLTWLATLLGVGSPELRSRAMEMLRALVADCQRELADKSKLEEQP